MWAIKKKIWVACLLGSSAGHKKYTNYKLNKLQKTIQNIFGAIIYSVLNFWISNIE